MKADTYKLMLAQLRSMLQGEKDETLVMADAAALLHDTFPDRFFWVGFYRVVGNELLLGPFQGPVACMHIGWGKGVCGKAWQCGETVLVPDVEQFPGHIACSSLSRSEIVVPLKDAKGQVRAVLDIDSRNLAEFDDTDRHALEDVAKTIVDCVY